jgi:hypothetical protein
MQWGVDPISVARAGGAAVPQATRVADGGLRMGKRGSYAHSMGFARNLRVFDDPLPTMSSRPRPPKAISKPPQSLLIANRLRPQSHSNATSKPPQSHPKATQRLPQGYPKATPKPGTSQVHVKCKPGTCVVQATPKSRERLAKAGTIGGNRVFFRYFSAVASGKAIWYSAYCR